MGLSALLSTQILDSSATGRSVLTGANAASIRTVLGLELDVVKTWNNGATVFTGLKLDVTDTASDASSAVIEMLVGGSSKFKVSKTGQITALAGGTTWLFQSDVATWSVSTAGVAGTPRASFKSAGFQSPGDGYFAFSNGTNGNGTLDVFLYRDAANNLAQRNGTNAQTSRIYGTFTDTSNYERGFLQADSNGFTLGHESLGTGTKRSVRILGASLAGAEAVSSLNIVQTWNTSGTPAMFQMNLTDTASNAASLLADWKVGANSFFTVAKDGSLTAGRFATTGFNGMRFTGGSLVLSRSSDGGSVITLDTSSNAVTAGSLTASNGRLTVWDAFLLRDASDILAVRNPNTGTNACGFRVYNTYTDASNYERARMSWESNQFVIGHEYLGTGAARTVAIVGGTTGTQGVIKAQTGGAFIGAQLNLSNSSNATASTSQVVLYTPAAGQLRITNATADGFDRLFLGLDTVSFPMIKRNAASINFRVGNDSADCDITAKACTFSGNVTVSAVNLVTDTTTGTKIGTGNTQKLGFWNATPLVQPTTAVGTATVVSGAGGIVRHDDTFDGYKVEQVVRALRNIGLLA